MSEQQEEFKVSGEELLGRVKELIKKGNVRRIIIKSKEGKTLVELPLTAGMVGGAALVLLAPTLAAVGSIAALVSECTLLVVREKS